MKIPLLDILRQWSSVSRQMIFIEDDGFQRRCKGLLDDEELGALMDSLAARPDAGKVIPGSGGLRKLRVAAKGHGKRGGARVIYFWWLRKSCCWTFTPKANRRICPPLKLRN